MKKNKMMRTASGLMIATLLTTGVISGTFAKYTTSDSASDTARVAKWGVELAVSGSLYGSAYGTDNKIAERDADNITVKSADAVAPSTTPDKVLAPGTQSDGGLHIFLTGTPEVSTKVTATIETQNVYLKNGEYGVMVKIDGITSENFVANKYYKFDSNVYTLADTWSAGDYYALEDYVKMDGDDDYYPVCYSGSGVNGANTSDSIKEIAVALAKKVKGSTSEVTPVASTKYSSKYEVNQVYDPNTSLDGLNINNTNISWNWAYENGKDAEDTILGDLNTNATVVMSTTDGYKKVTVTDGLARVDGVTEPVASLTTKFDVTLNVTQEN